MPYFHQICALCGCQILAAEPTGPVRWNNEFRAVYVRTIRTQDPVAFLTGVGKHTQPGSRTVHAPFDTQMHWSDDEFQPSTRNLISALDRNPVPQTDIPVGFLFHDACWRLFEEACKPRPIPLDRLAQVLISLPIYHPAGPNVLLDWGHNFGGAVALEPEDYAPWQWHREPPSPQHSNDGLHGLDAHATAIGHEKLNAVIVTNRGQILDLFRAPLPWGDVRVNSVEAAPGTVITGLYGTQSGSKIAALGAMTEKADE
ncbi:uncharacterized protein C8A04DRAFT_28823 [Dichotomopilus funicola]|uniref:Uncharacterized protein n=1 Tax=Dichotomopilus funicola TaxID=1934379 RepID=A0AAN6V3K0_9PEZI|nr:hypothetical protein C8A04DRAFT_28823 [Dichotomopilus funicola]